MDTVLLITNLLATWYMIGLIWMVQIVHYPLFGWVGSDHSEAFHHRHQNWTTWVVGPPMLIELATAILLFWTNLPAESWMLISGLALIVLIWLSTALIQVPCHAALLKSFDAATHRKLVRSNWIRTIAWTLRGILMAAILLRVLLTD